MQTHADTHTPVKVVGVCEACATDGAVGEAVLGMDEKMASK